MIGAVKPRARSASPALVLGGLLLVFVLFGLRADPPRPPQETPRVGPAARAGAADTTAAGADTAAVSDTSGAAPLAPPSTAELSGLSYQREFFDYDAGGRRDPFQPLLDVDTELEGPRFDELALTGIFKSPEGDGMVVVEDARRKGYFLKPGDPVGKATLVAIGADEATFEVRDFGISRRETLKLQRPEEAP